MEDLLSTVQLAARLGVSDQTILNYAKEGMPVVDVGGEGKGKTYRESECREWIAKNKGVVWAGENGAVGAGGGAGGGAVVGRGGRRKGAGRKPKMVGVGTTPPSANPDPVAVLALFGDDARRKAVLSDLKLGMDVLEIQARHSVTPQLARAIKELFDAQKAYLDTEERMGRLISAEEARTAWTLALTKVDTAVAGIPSRLGQELAALLGLDAVSQERVRVAVEGVVERVRDQIRQN